MPTDGTNWNGESALEFLDLTQHQTIKTLFAMGLKFKSVVPSDGVEGDVKFMWMGDAVTPDTADVMGSVTIDARTVFSASGKMEKEFLQKAVLWGAYQVYCTLTGETHAISDPPEAVKEASISAEKVLEFKETLEGAKKNVNPESYFTPQKKEKGATKMAEVFNLDNLTSVDTVKLSAATQLYQPVQGTGPSSRYFVVGIADGVKVAARIKGTGVSIRVEGERLKKNTFLDNLMAMGLSKGLMGDSNLPYASMHVDAHDPITAHKVVGSILSSIPAEWITPMPSSSVFAGKGS